MKRVILISSILFIVINLSAQEPYPQYWFYAGNAPIVQKGHNDVDEYDALKNAYLSENNSVIQDLDILYRMYEIEKTSQIFYATWDGKKLLFQCKDSVTDYKLVNFGAPLICNEEFFSKASVFRLRFENPITIIDPALFSSSVTHIFFPSTNNLIYESSPNIRVDNLCYLDGPGVVDNSALINKDSILIVAATCYINCFYVPNGVKAIGAGAFRGSEIEAIIIPSSVNCIGENAFDDTKISHIIIDCEEIPSFGMNCFGSNTDSDMRLYVHQKTLRNYKRIFPSLSKQILPIEKNHGALLYAEGLRALDKEFFIVALSFFEAAAQLGSAEANYQLGEMYLGAKGVERDAKKAYTFFEKAAKKKHVESMFMCYNYPRYWCHPADLNTATKWLKLAIKYNHEAAAFQLGHIYSDVDHNGFPLKLQEALDAYKKAYEISNGSTYAYENLKRVERLIELKADSRMKFSEVDMWQIDTNESAQYLLEKFRKKKTFCLYDMAIELMKEYVVEEEEALQDCKELIDKLKELGIISAK